VRYYTIEKKCNEVVNRLNRTKEERTVDFEAEHKKRLQQDKLRRKAAIEKQRLDEAQERERLCKEAELRSYSSVFSKISKDDHDHDGGGHGKRMDPEEARRRLEEDFF
jgi:hypothetical protein